MTSPTALTLDRLRRAGFVAGVVERWIEREGIRVDFLGIIDIIAAKPGESILAVQSTSASNVSARVAKAKGKPELATWLAAGARFQIWGWVLVNGRWHPRVIELRAGDMAAAIAQPLPRRRRKPRHVPACDLFVTLTD